MSAKRITEQTIFQPVLIKKFDSAELMVKELLRSVAVGLVTGECSPLGVSSDELMIKRIQGIALDKVWEGFRDSQRREMMQKLAKLLKTNQESFKNVEALIFSCGLVKTSSVKAGFKKMTLVHGDLGLSNLLLSGTDLKFIDFEHVFIGPLECELAPSVFWNDKNSLPVEILLEELDSVGIEIDQELLFLAIKEYFLLQMELSDTDQNKKTELLQIAKERGIA